MKNVLLITNKFTPTGAGAIRMLKFAKFLPEFGWHPLVLTVPGSSSTNEASANLISIYQASAPSFEPIFALARRYFPRRRVVKPSKKVDIKSFQGRGPRLTSWFMIPDSLVAWIPFAVGLGLKIARRHKIEAVVSSSPQQSCHLVAWILSKILHCAWVADFRDPWTTDPYRLYPTSFHKKINKVLERLVVTGAHQVITVSEVWRDEFLANYPNLNSNKFHVVANGFDPDDFAEISYCPKRNNLTQIVHNGAFFYSGKDPFPFLRAIKLLANNDEMAGVEVQFIGVPVDKLSPVIQDMKLTGIVKLKERLPHKDALKYVAQADILLLISGPKRGVLTAKVYEYLATGKPILALTPPKGALAALLHSTNVATEIVDPDSPQAIAEGLKKIIKRTREGNIPASNQDFIQQFSFRHQTGLLAKRIDEARQIANVS